MYSQVPAGDGHNLKSYIVSTLRTGRYYIDTIHKNKGEKMINATKKAVWEAKSPNEKIATLDLAHEQLKQAYISLKNAFPCLADKIAENARDVERLKFDFIVQT
jgi:hypothetical protein